MPPAGPRRVLLVCYALPSTKVLGRSLPANGRRFPELWVATSHLLTYIRDRLATAAANLSSGALMGSGLQAQSVSEVYLLHLQCVGKSLFALCFASRPA